MGTHSLQKHEVRREILTVRLASGAISPGDRFPNISFCPENGLFKGIKWHDFTIKVYNINELRRSDPADP